MTLLSSREKVEDILESEKVSPTLKKQLKLSQEILDFAERQLQLKTNGNYRDYVQLPERYPVWNVYAADPLSVQPYQWCYLLVGCVSYRGYFSEEKAWHKALELQQQGLEVFVHGVSAYSTLGWFDDPLLSSFVYRDEAELARLIFHELAHSVLYIDSDTAFNESFAEAVSQEALRRWFEHKGEPQKFKQFEKNEKIHQGFNQLLMQTRDALNSLFTNNDMSAVEKLKQKELIYLQLFKDYQKYKLEHQTDTYDYWMHNQMNNAKLAVMGDYFQWVPAFSEMIRRYPDEKISEFYVEVKRISELDPELRNQALEKNIDKNSRQ